MEEVSQHNDIKATITDYGISFQEYLIVKKGPKKGKIRFAQSGTKVSCVRF